MVRFAAIAATIRLNFHGHDRCTSSLTTSKSECRAISAGSAHGESFRHSGEGTAGDFRIRNVNGGIEMREVEGSGSVSR